MTNLSLACNQSWLFKIAGELSLLLEVSCSLCSLVELKRFLAHFILDFGDLCQKFDIV